MVRHLVRLARLQNSVRSKRAHGQLNRWLIASREDSLWFDLMDDHDALMSGADPLTKTSDRDLMRDYKDIKGEIDLFETKHGSPDEVSPHERRRLEREYADLWSSLEEIRQELSHRGLLSKVEKGSEGRRSRARRRA
jgi:hypothetical protein